MCWWKGRGGGDNMPRVFFATDLHGSEMCWRKFINAAKFYDAEVLICGGDMTGKAIVPIVAENGGFTVMLGGEQQAVAPDGVTEIENVIRRKGYYPLQMSVERLHELDQDPTKRAALQVRPRRWARDRRRPEAPARWRRPTARRLDRGARCHRAPSTAHLPAWSYPREQRRRENRQDPLDQSRQLI